jgi:hypothetical protein
MTLIVLAVANIALLWDGLLIFYRRFAKTIRTIVAWTISSTAKGLDKKGDRCRQNKLTDLGT